MLTRISQRIFLISTVLIVFAGTINAQHIKSKQSISVDASLPSMLEIKRGWGDWIHLQTTNAGLWALHNPTNQDALTLYYKDLAGNINYTLSAFPNGQFAIGANPVALTTAAPYKLFVGGGILTERVKVALTTGSEWSDYVFEPDYYLMPLPDVKSFIFENKHLPGFKSGKQFFEEGGIELKEIVIKQQAKIEELQLYILQLYDEIQMLKAK